MVINIRKRRDKIEGKEGAQEGNISLKEGTIYKEVQSRVEGL